MANESSCPICGKPSETAYRPFCSRRCADVDLSRWLRGAYAIPGGKSDAEDGETPEDSHERQEKHEARHEDE